MTHETFPKSQLPVRKTAELLPKLFQSDANNKFMAGAVDPLVQPGSLEKTVGYIGRRFGKAYNSNDVYLDTDNTLRSRYQLEPGVVVKSNSDVTDFYDYLDFKNQIKFFDNSLERDDQTTFQRHYTWNPPVDWDKFINYREYFWVPEGPPPVTIFGIPQEVTSTYRVQQGSVSAWVFSPDGLTSNPPLTLYKGHTYNFKINSPGEPFFIRRSLDLGSSLYNPVLSYSAGSVVVFDGKIYRAVETVNSQATPTPLDQDSRWLLLDTAAQNSFIDYNKGVTNNGAINNTIVFTVPYDSPDILYYQSSIDPNRFGKFIIRPVDENTFIDISADVLGKETYRSNNNVEFTNGLVVKFEGLVYPEKYSKDTWLVEGVGSNITLTRFNDLVVSNLESKNAPEVLFDNNGFDSLPFDDATSYPADKDYLTIAKSSIDRNYWSRYNRWFHRSVLEFSHAQNSSSFNSPEDSRAKRPVIEFKGNLQLFNFGSIAKETVDYVDDFTDDVFSIVEGSRGYNIDGEDLFEGARILVTNDKDSLANNRIYLVTFITHNNRRQISLLKTSDSESVKDQCVLIRRGKINKGVMYHFDGIRWIKSQVKTSVNQAPLFDIFDNDGYSFSDEFAYTTSSFFGSEIVSYKIGNSFLDAELGFSLSYLNIDNVGDIQFEFDLEIDQFTYQNAQDTEFKKVSSGFYRFNHEQLYYENGWTPLDTVLVQPIVETITINRNTNTFVSSATYWNRVSPDQIKKIIFYVNGNQLRDNYVREENTFIFSKNFKENDVVTLKLFGDVEPNVGYYEIPLGLEKNPLNQEIRNFTLGQATDHVSTGLELTDNFEGVYPGQNNLRDLPAYQNLPRRFLKHSGVTPLSILLLCDKQTNIIKSLDYSKNSYSEFKNNFVKLSTILPYNDNVSDFVDTIINEMSRSKNSVNAFFGSDMIGSGAYTESVYTVEDEGIKTFVLSDKFDLGTISNQAVYVYLNGVQLIHERDYAFNSNFGFISLLVELTENDQIKIREYSSTLNSYIPSTPTKLGLYKKYTPAKFIDDTYLTPKEVIQGHDGSIVTAYGDFRDELILELELRIYNNIKQEYNSNNLDTDLLLGGYYGSSIFTKKELDSLMSKDFLRWVSKVNIDYIDNIYFDTEDAFTFTYSNMTDPSGTQNLPGWWRGVYYWFYDTVRPHTNPWEMLGFSQQPDWWKNEYGAAPYTNNNLILWEDLENGIIRHGSRAGIHNRYKRPGLVRHIPVDSSGKLLNPLDSGLAGNFVLINNRGTFKFGDVSPVEYAWRSSSEYPFAIISALCLLRPFDYIPSNFSKSESKNNSVGQVVNTLTETFITLRDFADIDRTKSSGLFVYIADYLKGKTVNASILNDKIQNIDVLLSSRISGFVDKQQQKYLLDSKNPKSTSSSIFIPQENYDIFFNVSNPISSISYSGVVIEKAPGGWKILGYDSSNPFFNYFSASPTTADSLITVGGISESFLNWSSDKFYGNGIVVRYENKFYRSLRSHTSGNSFDTSLWKLLPSLPAVGAVEALLRKQFNKLTVRILSYGQTLPSVQDVVDFLLGYQEYQKSVGIQFNGYDSETQTARDWLTSAKEFMYWTKHNWEVGSLLSLSPNAQKIEISFSLGFADNLLDNFYDYQVYKNDGTPLQSRFVDVLREFQKVTVSTNGTEDGIYFLKIYFVLKEHVVLFDDRTVFNDVIYDKSTGYRQERIKVRGFRTVDWDGDYTSPGFLFDNVSIAVWQPFIDYRLGDIVSYKSYKWTSRFNHAGVEEFNESFWTRLDSTPEKGLVSNFDYKISQFEDYYEVTADGVGSSQRDLARHAIGYQQRDYLQNIAEDEVTQFKIYQGFIREKGTANSVLKVFNKLSDAVDNSITLNEEWAFKLGTFGGTDQVKEVEFTLRNSEFQLNPQPIIIETTRPRVIDDQFLRVTKDDFTIVSIPFSPNITPLAEYSELTRDAGYVSLDQIKFIVNTRADLLNIIIEIVSDNDNFWVTFENNNWTVLRYNDHPEIQIVSLDVDDNIATITVNQIHNLSENDIVGIRNTDNVSGFYKIFNVEDKIFSIILENGDPGELSTTAYAFLGLFTEARFSNYESIDSNAIPLLKTGSKLWIDSNENGKWEVIEKTQQYTSNEIKNYGIEDPSNIGAAVVYVDSLKQVITSAPQPGFILVYNDSSYLNANNQILNLRQIVSPEIAFTSSVENVFAEVLSISPDNKWLIAGSPGASNVPSKYVGIYNSATEYQAGDIVLDMSDIPTTAGKLWEAVRTISAGTGSTILLGQEDWRPASIINANQLGSGTGFTNQGLITLYRYENNQWIAHSSILSPRPSTGEKFGSAISIGGSGTNYYMAVSATGSLSSTGRTYLFYFNGASWNILDNSNYLGVYSDLLSINYFKDSVVWYNNKLWKAIVDTTGGLDIEDSPNWTKFDSTLTQNILPTNPGIPDDGSTLGEGLLDQDQVVELVQPGDKFGFSVAMNKDGSVLVIGAPDSDGRYYSTYKGTWDSYQPYVEMDVVKYHGAYYILQTGASQNQVPDSAGSPWEITNSENLKEKSGKVFIYKRDSSNRYVLLQVINANNLIDVSDIGAEEINSGDYLGYSLDVDWSGNTIIVSAPLADINFQDQGSVYVFKMTDNSLVSEYRLVQKLESFEDNVNEFFGSSVSISPGTEKVVVGAKNSSSQNIISLFDEGFTIFDQNQTTFNDEFRFSGQVYIFENKLSRFLLTEKLQASTASESFGASVDSVRDIIVVGAPQYTTNELVSGTVRLFRKAPTASSLSVIAKQQLLVDIDRLKNVTLYDETNLKIADIDVVDYYKMKILNQAEREISFKTLYDPAIYMIATDAEVIDSDQAWFEKNVGKIWWDISTVKFLNYEQGSTSYRIGNWNSLVPGSSIDVYEWVETPLLPSEWSLVADTTDGLLLRVSGQPKFPDDTVYNTRVKLNPATGEESGTLYYFWVKNSTIVPLNNPERINSASAVTGLIENPISSGLPFLAAIDQNIFLAYNFKTYINSDSANLNFTYSKFENNLNNIHSEYQLLVDGVADSVPNIELENKWIDSLLGQDRGGNRVPDLSLKGKQQYGVSCRPRQTMFVDKNEALEIVFNNINTVLTQQPFADTINFTSLNSIDSPPNVLLNEYDVEVDNFIDLETISTVRIKQAILSVNLVNGALDTIDIVDPGFGYKVAPPIKIDGTGQNATAICTIDNQGRISAVTVTQRGRRYSSAIAKVREFSILVSTDAVSDNNWSIYSWDARRKEFYKRVSQAFNVPKYWDYTDWWDAEYSELSRITTEIESFYQIPSLSLQTGDLIKVKEFASGGWAIFKKMDANQDDVLSGLRLVGRRNGTIQINDIAYNIKKLGIGYNGSASYDSVFYDLQNARELRIILESVKNDIFINDLKIEWNKLFFSSIRYAFSQQLYINWAFKTSFLSAMHNIGELQQKTNYKNDNLDSYKSYLEEVKPFRTTIRKYTSRYTRMENTPTAVTDFDAPPSYSIVDGKILPNTDYYNRNNEYPWKWWADNTGYAVDSIELYDQGGDYTSVPTVLIEGNGTGASAQAYTAGGKVVSIRVISSGAGYTQTPVVSVVGGNGNSLRTAKAVAVLGQGLVRSFNTTIKFDRISKQGIFKDLVQEEEFTASGSSSVFQLKYAPTEDQTKISLFRNEQTVLTNEYRIEMYKEFVNAKLTLKGKLILSIIPAVGDIIKIIYEKNSDYFDSVNRIEQFYAPTSGMIGKELPQLMTGIDFGGVQVQGTTFDITGGWDAIPWSTDNWDNIESTDDMFIAVDSSTESITLPRIPAVDEFLSIYLQRVNPANLDQYLQPVRIDDPYYDLYDGSTVQPNNKTTAPANAVINSFIGNGIDNVIAIPQELVVDTGDVLIFRTADSDGTININDVNLLDTQISGGSLASINNAYVTATGILAEDIVIDGEAFISPDQVPAPEENVPGQVLDSVSIKVYSSTLFGATPIHSSVYTGNSSNTMFDIGLTVFEESSVLVYVDKVKQINNIDYSINFLTNKVLFLLPPTEGVVIEIISIGIGGSSLIDYQEFVADGVTKLFLTKAPYDQTASVLVSIDGVHIDTQFINSSDVLDTKNKTLIQFGFAPDTEQVVKIVSIGTQIDTGSLIRVNEQQIISDGSSRTFVLDNFVNLASASAQSSIVVDINGRQLSNIDTIYFEYDGANSEIELGQDPEELPGTITTQNIKVYVNDQLKSYIVDYTFDINVKTVFLNTENLSIGDTVKIEVNVRTEYTISDNELTISSLVDLNFDDVITVIWFDNYATASLLSDQYAGGKIKYILSRPPISSDYVWVYKNGTRLTKYNDFTVSVTGDAVILKDTGSTSDIIKIVEFSGNTYRKTPVYEIFKDMLNIYRYKRYSKTETVKLASPLNYYDKSIHISDASSLFDPVVSKNLPGVIEINNERIEYFSKDGNTLSQLKRGSHGTAIAALHIAGSYVVDVGPSETVPYAESQQIINDNDPDKIRSSPLIGPLEFVPTKSGKEFTHRGEISETYGMCDEIEIFVGGRRLRKNSIAVYNEINGSTSPNADEFLEAEFSVDGVTPYVLLTDLPMPGVQVSIVRKQGKVWYDAGKTTASAGKTFFENDNEIIKFISEKGSELPE